jgi:hypothetical protein
VAIENEEGIKHIQKCDSAPKKEKLIIWFLAFSLGVCLLNFTCCFLNQGFDLIIG